MYQQLIAVIVTCLAGLMFSQQSNSAVLTFNSQPDWISSIQGSSGVTVFHFDGATETDGKYANDPTIIPSYSSQGVDFLPFTGTTEFPVILRDQGHQIPDSSRDGLLTNISSPNPETDLDGRAIKFSFNKEIKSVGVFTNAINSGDGGYLQAYDQFMGPIGRVTLNPGIFGGLAADQPIKYVAIVNTFDADIQFGIWDLQFSANGPAAVPVPSAVWLFGSTIFGMIGFVRRKTGP